MATSLFPSFLHRLAALALGAGASLGALAQADFAEYRLRDLSALTGLDDVSVFSMNRRGDFTLLDFDSRHSFLWRGGRLHDLGAWGGGDVVVNDRGEVAGARLGADGSRRPFVWRDGSFKDLSGVLGTRDGQANGINARGAVIGTADGLAYVWEGGRVRWLDVPGARGSVGLDINDRGLVVGGFEPGEGDDLDQRGFTAPRGGGVTVMGEPIVFEYGGEYSFTAVNERGNAVVRWYDYNWGEVGSSLWIDGRYVNLGSVSLAVDINNRDLAVGTDVYEVDYHEYERVAMLYRAEGSRALDDLLIGSAAEGWRLESANAVNDRGQFIGRGTAPDGSQRIYLATPVPEAGSWAMLLAGMGVVGAVAARRRRAGDPAAG
ncbi:PEP-CTERM sorting domain-containing protein [Azohydromonas aeria]|uniref:PEP-CTERM sorting domain-containing protein n=1 Tax=Azohydromonas aeria TaxID=2590212 RepID=UPI001E32A286|nr:PEP-CTERM sorting domain-containing protein [Azohydromonas aeria]